MKEQTLVKMQYDLKLVQQALVVALNKIEVIEKKLEKKYQLLAALPIYLKLWYNQPYGLISKYGNTVTNLV